MADTVKPGKEINRGNGNGALDRVNVFAVTARNRVKAMPARQRRWMGVATLLVLALAAGLMWYASRTDWKTLYSGLDAKDMQQMAQELSAAGIAYELTEDGGGVRVAAEQVDKARMEIAAKGMPQSGRMGFELFDKPNWVGSEFDEKVNYQRAMEGELEHTIGTLSVVRSARVHLVLPKDSMFVNEKGIAKASVVLQLRRASMPAEQVESIRNLVAGAVENLSPGEVTLVDADGRLNLSAPTRSTGEGDAERAIEAKLVAMLEPAAGQNNVRATVNVSYDESSQEKTDEIYDPTQAVALTLQKSEQTATPQPKPAGIPGTVSNTPGVAAPGSAQAAAAVEGPPSAAVPPLLQAVGPVQKDAGLPVYPQNGWMGSGPMQTVREENGTYAVTRHLLHEEQTPGRVRRVTAAIVVNDRESSEGTGKLEHAVWKTRSPEEMHRLEQLARAAVGFDEARGDAVVIENVSFSSNVPEVKTPMVQALMEQTGGLLREQPGLLKTLGIAALGLLLVMVVLRPVASQMIASLKGPDLPLLLAQRAAEPGGAGHSSALVTAVPVNSLAEPSLPAANFDFGSRSTEAKGVYDHVSAHIRKEPSISTRLLQSWIGSPIEEVE
jgi:flagellar M-ring protein FliF